MNDSRNTRRTVQSCGCIVGIAACAPTHQRQSLLAISASKTRVIDAARSRSPLNQRCAESKMSQLASIAHNPERVVKSDVDATGPRRRAVDVSSQSGVVRMMSIAATGCSKQCRASEKQSPRSGAGNEGLEVLPDPTRPLWPRRGRLFDYLWYWWW